MKQVEKKTEKVIGFLMIIFMLLVSWGLLHIEEPGYQEKTPTVDEVLTIETRSHPTYQSIFASFEEEAKRCGGGINNGDDMDHCYLYEIVQTRNRYLEEKKCVPWGRWWMDNTGATHDNVECRQ